jgi:hypothetical protein
MQPFLEEIMTPDKLPTSELVAPSNLKDLLDQVYDFVRQNTLQLLQVLEGSEEGVTVQSVDILGNSVWAQVTFLPSFLPTLHLPSYGAILHAPSFLHIPSSLPLLFIPSFMHAPSLHNSFRP